MAGTLDERAQTYLRDRQTYSISKAHDAYLPDKQTASQNGQTNPKSISFPLSLEFLLLLLPFFVVFFFFTPQPRSRDFLSLLLLLLLLLLHT